MTLTSFTPVNDRASGNHMITDRQQSEQSDSPRGSRSRSRVNLGDQMVSQYLGLEHEMGARPAVSNLALHHPLARPSGARRLREETAEARKLPCAVLNDQSMRNVPDVTTTGPRKRTIDQLSSSKGQQTDETGYVNAAIEPNPLPKRKGSVKLAVIAPTTCLDGVRAAKGYGYMVPNTQIVSLRRHSSIQYSRPLLFPSERSRHALNAAASAAAGAEEHQTSLSTCSIHESQPAYKNLEINARYDSDRTWYELTGEDGVQSRGYFETHCSDGQTASDLGNGDVFQKGDTRVIPNSVTETRSLLNKQHIPTPLPSDAISFCSNSGHVAPQTDDEIPSDDEWISDTDLDGLIDMTMTAEKTLQQEQAMRSVWAHSRKPLRLKSQNSRDVDPEHVTYPFLEATTMGNSEATPGPSPADHESPPVSKSTARRPIVRTPFPIPTKDRSPVIGLSSDTVLRTCFRVGEALNTGCQAVRLSRGVVIELYARVTASWREPQRASGTGRQHFTLADLFHGHAPFLEGVYDGWKGVDGAERESARFLTATLEAEGRICRCVGRMRRVDQKWRFHVTSICEMGWENVEHIAAIYGA